MNLSFKLGKLKNALFSLPYFVPITLNKFGYCSLLTELPLQIKNPLDLYHHQIGGLHQQAKKHYL